MPFPLFLQNSVNDAPMAQWLEYCATNLQIEGSNPTCVKSMLLSTQSEENPPLGVIDIGRTHSSGY